MVAARFTFTIPDELLERAKQVAEARGVSIAEVINSALRDSLECDRIADLEKRVAELEKETFGEVKK